MKTSDMYTGTGYPDSVTKLITRVCTAVQTALMSEALMSEKSEIVLLLLFAFVFALELRPR